MVEKENLEKIQKKIHRIESLKWIEEQKKQELNVLYEQFNQLLQQDIKYR